MKLSTLGSWRSWLYTAPGEEVPEDSPNRVELVRLMPFLALHLLCLGVIWTGWSWAAVGVAAALYLFRMFAITGFYHRYFSHKTFSTNRFWQLVFAVWGNLAVQRGPLWWAAHHRRHHQRSDRPDDVHSPRQHGFVWSHFGWILTGRHVATDWDAIRDLAKYPELRFLDRHHHVVPILFFGSLYALGEVLATWAPGLGTDGWQLLVWGGGISTIVLFHATGAINSLAHQLGRPRFHTGDDSRNSLLLALITLGEGWHNNHHYYARSCRQGFYWWEVDPTYYGLRLLAALGIIRDVHGVPERVLAEGRAKGAVRHDERDAL